MLRAKLIISNHLKVYLCYRMNDFLIKSQIRASLVAEWVRIHMPMKGTWVQSLIWEDSTSYRATKPVGHSH